MAAIKAVKPIVGLEIHAQLACATKLFCACAMVGESAPNSRICPVCTGQPGALPVLNRGAVELAVRAGLALNCEINLHSRWDRKSYFYPDLPKNYQISQYDEPLGRAGWFELKHEERIHKIRITRAHLEEDAGKTTHVNGDEPLDLIDFNRAGAPLLEIVTAPDFSCPRTVTEFAVEMQRLLRYLGVSAAKMAAGQLRFEPNINLELTLSDGRRVRTPIVEVKNLNSFKALEAAIAFEIERQQAAWLRDGHTASEDNKENRGWNEARGETVAQRAKEAGAEYRFFPEPDLPRLELQAAWVAELREHLPELPLPRIERFVSEYKVTAHEAAALVTCRPTADLLDAAVEAGGPKAVVAKQFLSIWAQQANQRGTTIAGLGLPAEHLAAVARLVEAGTVNATAAARLAEELCRRADALLDGVARPSAGGLSATFPPIAVDACDPEALAETLGLVQTDSRSQIAAWVREVFANHPSAVRDALQNLKKAEAARGFLVGRVMQRSGGRGNPQVVRALVEDALRSAATKDALVARDDSTDAESAARGCAEAEEPPARESA